MIVITMRYNYEVNWKRHFWMVYNYDVINYFLSHRLWVPLKNRRDSCDFKAKKVNFFEFSKEIGNFCRKRVMGCRKKS